MDDNLTVEDYVLLAAVAAGDASWGGYAVETLTLRHGGRSVLITLVGTSGQSLVKRSEIDLRAPKPKAAPPPPATEPGVPGGPGLPATADVVDRLRQMKKWLVDDDFANYDNGLDDAVAEIVRLRDELDHAARKRDHGCTGDPVTPDALERKMQIAQDTKKEFVRVKDDGLWYWFKGWECRSEGFPTFLAALDDAIAPYEGDET